jgi:hypothetical protein
MSELYKYPHKNRHPFPKSIIQKAKSQLKSKLIIEYICYSNNIHKTIRSIIG